VAVAEHEESVARDAVLRELRDEGVEVGDVVVEGVDVPAAAVGLAVAAQVHERHLQARAHEGVGEGGVAA
jgi:hypothetical protein